MRQSIWISGSRGYVGSNLNQYLKNLNYFVKGITNKGPVNRDIVYVNYSKPKEIYKALEKHGMPDSFVHLGWGNVYDVHDKCHITENVKNSMNLIDILYEKGLKRFISVGSVSEYGDRVGVLKETDAPLGFLNNYVKGKILISEYGLKAAKKANQIFIHIRLFYTYGAGQTHNSLINQLYKAYLRGDNMNLSPCDQFRDYIYLSQAIMGMEKILNLENSEIINLSGGRIIELKEFVKIFWKELGGNPEKLIFGAHERPSYEQNQPKAYADLTRLKYLTNWYPSMSIEDGIRQTINELKKANN